MLTFFLIFITNNLASYFSVSWCLHVMVFIHRSSVQGFIVGVFTIKVQQAILSVPAALWF